jgi:predicted nucleotidyltransferase
MSKSISIERQAALALAERCADVLRSRFGARRVIPFGSVKGLGPWHTTSDLDLAVEGLAPDQFFRAWAVLQELLPDGLDVDLVSLEDIEAGMRARILGETKMPEDPLLALKELIEEELSTLQRVVRDVQEEMRSAASPPSQFAMHALASYLHQFYTGCERMFERVALQVDGGLPGGAFSHANLLAQMAHEIPDVRPAVLHEALWLRLQDYLAFRHFFRHAYGYTLEWAKLRPLVEGMSDTLTDVEAQLQALFDALLNAQ